MLWERIAFYKLKSMIDQSKRRCFWDGLRFDLDWSMGIQLINGFREWDVTISAVLRSDVFDFGCTGFQPEAMNV
jgi:hypothetical protein